MDWHRFFRISPDLTFWQILDSQFWTTILAALFGVLLLRYESNLRDAQAEAQAAEDALRTREEVERKEAEHEDAEAEAEAAVPVNPQVVNRREDARIIIDGAKEYLETVAEADPDGRHLRTYSKISGHHPLDLALALRDRRQLTIAQFDAAFSLFTKWKKFARGRAANNVVSDADIEEMTRYRNDLARS